MIIHLQTIIYRIATFPPREDIALTPPAPGHLLIEIEGSVETTMTIIGVETMTDTTEEGEGPQAAVGPNLTKIGGELGDNPDLEMLTEGTRKRRRKFLLLLPPMLLRLYLLVGLRISNKAHSKVLYLWLQLSRKDPCYHQELVESICHLLNYV